MPKHTSTSSHFYTEYLLFTILTDTHNSRGAAGGIGLETVKVFLQLGARVTAHYNSKLGELAILPSESVQTVQADVRKEGAVEKLFEGAERKNKWGPVVVLVVNHGIWPEENR